jgi:hypothetical protein
MMNYWIKVAALLILSSTALAGEADLSWNAPVLNEDGSALTDLAGYKVYWGPTSGIYPSSVDVADVTAHTVADLTEGGWFFAVTAYDTAGNESGESNEVSKIISIAPMPPSLLTVTNLTAFTIVKQENRFILLAVGSVPSGTSCDSSQSVNGHYAVPISAVTWSGTVRPVVVVADCS